MFILIKEDIMFRNRLTPIVLVIIAVFVFMTASCNRKPKYETEVYGYQGQTIYLYADGVFAALLAHNVRINGTYTKATDGETVIVTFSANRNVTTGRIINNSLHIPREWDDGHGHGNVFPRTN